MREGVDLTDGIRISDEHGEIVLWNEDELAEDVEAVLAAAQAMKIYYEEGAAVLRGYLTN